MTDMADMTDMTDMTDQSDMRDMTDPSDMSDMRDMNPAMMAAWRAQGAQHVDPVRFCYLEALARRAASREGAVRQALDFKLAQAVAEYGSQLEQARSAARDALARQTARFPDAADKLTRLHAQGDFKAQHRLAALLAVRADGGPLGELVRHIDRQGMGPQQTGPADTSARPAPAPPTELKALQQFRSTWSRLRVNQQISRSLAQVPDNPGPLNSQLLVLRSLKLMQDIAPAYLQGFMTQMETLLWLDEAQMGSTPVQSRPVRRDSGAQKRKAGRVKTG